eukprot:GHVL01043545.1.p1 GENE.GHVL01043545.1~~GHVL01043545.1.p1  ORF type:complete len:320 (+),score=40.12 GHVL01043545.1:141-1100(+)
MRFPIYTLIILNLIVFIYLESVSALLNRNHKLNAANDGTTSERKKMFADEKRFTENNALISKKERETERDLNGLRKTLFNSLGTLESIDAEMHHEVLREDVLIEAQPTSRGDACPILCKHCARSTVGECANPRTMHCKSYSIVLEGAAKKYSCDDNYVACWRPRISPWTEDKYFPLDLSDSHDTPLIIQGENLHKCLVVMFIDPEKECDRLMDDLLHRFDYGVVGSSTPVNVEGFGKQQSAKFLLSFTKPGRMRVCAYNYLQEERVTKGQSSVDADVYYTVGFAVVGNDLQGAQPLVQVQNGSTYAISALLVLWVLVLH